MSDRRRAASDRAVDRRRPHLRAGHTVLRAAEARFVDEDGSEQHYRMGCYGFGIGRTMAAAVEQFHDDAGIALPKVLAPFEVVVVIANRDVERVVAEGERVLPGASRPRHRGRARRP